MNLKELGVALRAYRIAVDESLDDLASAIELSVDLLNRLEAGMVKPDQSVLELLSRHFNLKEQEAMRLLKLSGYTSDEFKFNLEPTNIDIESLKDDMDVMIAPVFYTDMVNVVSNQFGVTINFIQHGTKGEKPIVVSRVGMSHQHAESVIKVLQQSLKTANQKNLDENQSQNNKN